MSLSVYMKGPRKNTYSKSPLLITGQNIVFTVDVLKLNLKTINETSLKLKVRKIQTTVQGVFAPSEQAKPFELVKVSITEVRITNNFIRFSLGILRGKAKLFALVKVRYLGDWLETR